MILIPDVKIVKFNFKYFKIYLFDILKQFSVLHLLQSATTIFAKKLQARVDLQLI